MVDSSLKRILMYYVLFGGGALAAFDYCPCVPDRITFQFDFAWGCGNNPMNNADFSIVKCYITSGRLPSNQSIRKVVYTDLDSGETGELPVVETTSAVVDEDHHSNNSTNATVLQKTYTFDYHRSYHSPTKLLMDFYQAGASKPVAMIDLYYRGRSADCVSAHNPLYWPGDVVYFTKVVRMFRTVRRWMVSSRSFSYTICGTTTCLMFRNQSMKLVTLGAVSQTNH